ncbi:MAG TPA: beta-1,6-N-acetylglucosaminyltransferase [Mucilaginibacter sp.]|nr:beta-1,6-N-acetylglucosaminyltransferase [Mucilaginibacter sp.]
MANLRIAYLITFYKDIEHLGRLITNIQGAAVDIYIHNDKKNNINLKLIEGQYEHGKIFVLDDPLIITWGGFNLTRCFIMLMNTCLKNGVYDYIFLISGQDFPLANHHQINSFLLKNKGKEFVEYYDIPYAGWPNLNGGIDRYQYLWPVDDMGLYKAQDFVNYQKKENIKRPFPEMLKPYGGSCWFTITYRFMEYICNYLDDHQEYLYEYFNYVLLADEILLQSIMLNSPFKNNIVNNNLRYIDWHSGPEYPKLLTIADNKEMHKSDCLFARKFDSATDNEIINLLERKLQGSSRSIKTEIEQAINQ